MPAHKLSTDAERFWLSVDRSADGCWPWTGNVGNNGYGQIGVGSRAEGTFRMVSTHRFALEQALDRPLPTGMCALHTCDVRTCVRNDDVGWYEINGVLRPRRGHLWEGTNQDNTADRHAKGRSAVGDRNHGNLRPETRQGEAQWLAKLTEDQVRSIRRLAADGVSQSALAAEFGVGKTNIYKIVKRESWKHV